jgi:excisionase family DNA binding protein
MRNKVDRRDLSQLRNEVDLLSLRLDDLTTCDPGTIRQMLSRISRIEDTIVGTKPVLTTAETAAYLGVSREKVYQLVKKAGLPHFRNGRKLLFERNKLTEWIMGNINR